MWGSETASSDNRPVPKNSHWRTKTIIYIFHQNGRLYLLLNKQVVFSICQAMSSLY